MNVDQRSTHQVVSVADIELRTAQYTEALDKQRLRDQPIERAGAIANGDIRKAGPEIHDLIGRVEAQVEEGMVRAERTHRREQAASREQSGRGERHRFTPVLRRQRIGERTSVSAAYVREQEITPVAE